MKAGKITAKIRDAVKVRLMEDGKERMMYRNIDLPDAIKELEIRDFNFDVHLDGKIDFQLHFNKGVLPEVFPAIRPKGTRKLKTPEATAPSAPQMPTTAAPAAIAPKDAATALSAPVAATKPQDAAPMQKPIDKPEAPKAATPAQKPGGKPQAATVKPTDNKVAKPETKPAAAPAAKPANAPTTVGAPAKEAPKK